MLGITPSVKYELGNSWCVLHLKGFLSLISKYVISYDEYGRVDICIGCRVPSDRGGALRRACGRMRRINLGGFVELLSEKHDRRSFQRGRHPVLGMLLVVLLALGSNVSMAAENVEITIGYYESTGGLGQHGVVMNSIIEQFMAEHPHIKVSTSIAGYGDFYAKLPVELAAGVGPDVWLSDGVLIDQYSGQGFALDLTDRIEREIDTKNIFGLEDNRDPNGRIWAFPQGVQSSALFYNKEMFDSAGLRFPDESWTMNDLREAARLLTRDSGGRGTPDRFGFRAANQITEGWYPIIRAFGGSALDDSRRRSRFADRETIDGLEFMTRMIFEDQSSPATGVGGSNFNWFPQQLVAMQFGIYNRTFAANQAGFDYDVTVMPYGPAGRFNPVIVNSWIINAHSDQAKQEAAWAWIKFFAGEKAQTAWADLGEAISINRDVAIATFSRSQAAPDNVMAFVEGLNDSTPLDSSPVWSSWQSAATKALDPAFRGNVGIEEAAINADHAIQVILDEYYNDK